MAWPGDRLPSGPGLLARVPTVGFSLPHRVASVSGPSPGPAVARGASRSSLTRPEADRSSRSATLRALQEPATFDEMSRRLRSAVISPPGGARHPHLSRPREPVLLSFVLPRGDAGAGSFAVDAFEQAGKDAAGADFVERVKAVGDHFAHRIFPADAS